MHCAQNYFSPKQRSDVDVEVEAGTEDAAYLAKLQSWLVTLREKIYDLNLCSFLLMDLRN